MKPSDLFEVLAEKTWRSIERCSKNRIHWGEDAITSSNLDALASARPAFVFAEDARAHESTKGCDFEMWIGNDTSGWRRYAVQAKKLQFSSGRYASLAHKVGGTRQIDILESYATANRALPIYCFYNRSDKSYHWNCSLPDRASQLGCSVAPIDVVQRALAKHGGRSFSFIHSQLETLPWRCLVRCADFTQPSSDASLCPTTLSDSEAAHGAKLHHQGWPDPSGHHHKELPKSLRILRDHGSLSSFDDLPDLFNGNTSLRPDWVGVVEVPTDTE